MYRNIIKISSLIFNQEKLFELSGKYRQAMGHEVQPTVFPPGYQVYISQESCANENFKANTKQENITSI